MKLNFHKFGFGWRCWAHKMKLQLWYPNSSRFCVYWNLTIPLKSLLFGPSCQFLMFLNNGICALYILYICLTNGGWPTSTAHEHWAVDFTRAQICKRLRSLGSGNRFRKPMKPGGPARRTKLIGLLIHMTLIAYGRWILVVVPARQAGNWFLGSLKGLQIRAQG